MSAATGLARVADLGAGSEAVDGYAALRAAGVEAVEAGDLRQARGLFASARESAAAAGDADLADRATCNLAAVDLALGELAGPLPELRRILMAHRSAENCFLAAYNMARALELAHEPKKGLFYARIARDRALQLGRPEWVYGARNQLANLLVADSFFAEAIEEYHAALGALPAGERHHRIESTLNLGYCHLMQGDTGRAFELLYGALRTARQRRLGRLEMIARLDLALALLEADRCRTARHHVSIGLAMAEESGEADMIKNGLYLAGEVHLALGEAEAAAARHRELQERFYPGRPEIARLLGAVDLRPLLNLRA
jgi:hypothetical protein